MKAKEIINKEKIDFIADEIHGLPFFTPLLFRQRKVLLVCEVAGEIWDKMWPFPINIIGKTMEKIIYLIYGKIEMWAISDNTKKDILNLNSKAKVKILPLGIDIVERKKYQKTTFPSAVFVARLVPMKGIEIALEAAKKIAKDIPDFKLFVIGRGTDEYEKELKRRVSEMHLENTVEFLGYVSEEDKYRYLSQAYFLFHPSYKEGFGLTVLEAGLVGTPAIVKKGSSLDELITDGKDGYVVNSAEEIGLRFIKHCNKKSITILGQNSRLKALQYSWDSQLIDSDNITGL